MPNPIVAIKITEEALPLITVLNSGVKPVIIAEDDYYICEIDSPTTTTKHDIISAGTFHALTQVTDKDITIFEVKK